MVYLSNLFGDIKRFKAFAVLFIFACAAAGALFGYRKAGLSVRISAEEQEQINLYNEKIADYDDVLSDLEKTVLEQEKTVESLQDYIDNSIFMQMDPNSVKYATVQYAITYGEGVSAGNVNNALITYIKDGGLKESIENPEELEVKYWNEVLTQTVSGNTLNITMMHYDMEKAKTCLREIKKQLRQKTPELKVIHGEFSLTEVDASSFERSEASIINSQNSNYNNLRSYVNNVADLKSKRNNTQTTRDKYVEDNRPEALDKKPISAKKNAVKFMIIGFCGAVLLLIALELFICLYGESIKNVYAVEAIGIPVLSVKNGKIFRPDLGRAVMDISLLNEIKSIKGVHIQALSKGIISGSEIDSLKEAMECEGLNVTSGNGIFELASDVRSAMNAGCCVLLVKMGCTQVKELKEAVNVCRKYGVEMPGCILF